MDNLSHQIYLQYFGMGEDAWRGKVRFYEENEKKLTTLSFDDKIELDMDYLLCLFEVGRYDRFLSKVDPVLENVIAENIYHFKGENIFFELLFKKAASYFQLKQFEKSKTILKQLIKMDRSKSIYLGLYSICNRKLNNDINRSIKATAMAAFLIALSITLARIFLEPFFDVYIQPFLILRTGLIIYAISCLFILELTFQFKIKKETGMFTISLFNRIYGDKV
ncbi:MAG: hypothetical protein IPL55_14650 [Saprospiraceae bacterium]|nr:hypothetical protein [Saprospiraceae bacterium]